MERVVQILYAGNGPVGERCAKILDELGTDFEYLKGEVSACDLLISVHWRTKFTVEELKRCKIGALNLHNSYLPYNKGADACSWAIVDQTPHGATLHWIDEGIDTGPIFFQLQLNQDAVKFLTAHELYQETTKLEEHLFRSGMIVFLRGERHRIPQKGTGSLHRKADFKLLTRAVTTRDWKAVPNEV